MNVKKKNITVIDIVTKSNNYSHRSKSVKFIVSLNVFEEKRIEAKKIIQNVSENSKYKY